MSEFSGLRKHEKTQHALVGLGNAALASAVAVPRKCGPNFPKGIINCKKKKSIKSVNPGFDPLVGQGEGQFFYPSKSTLVQTCLCRTPAACVRHAPKFLLMLRSHIHLS